MTEKKTRASGVVFGTLAGMTWGLDTVLLGIILAAQPFVSDPVKGPLLATFFHDSVSFLFLMAILLFKGRMGAFFKGLRTRSGLFIMLAGLCGGPLGMTAYLFAIQRIGSSNTAVITAIFPAVGAVLAYVFLRDKLKPLGLLGFVITITASAMVGFSASESAAFNWSGFAFAILCTLGWGMEAVICAYGMKNDVDPDVAIGIRQMTSALSYAFVIIPLTHSMKLAPSGLFAQRFWPLLIVTALAGSLSYLFYYKAIDSIGPTRSMGLNISYSAWAIFIGAALGHGLDLRLLFLSLIIIAGSMMTAEDFLPQLGLLKYFKKNTDAEDERG